MLSYVHTFTLNGIDAVPVTIECEVKPGIGIHLIGLADSAVKESLLRTVTAMQSCGYRIPGKKVIINVAPADPHVSCNSYDLAIAVAMIAATEQADLPHLDKFVIAGELGLDGRLRDIYGGVSCAKTAAERAMGCILPTSCARQASNALHDNTYVFGASDLREALKILGGELPKNTADYPDLGEHVCVWDEILWHAPEKRALEIAAAGGHPLILVGSQNSGRERLARALCDILPPMNEQESLEVQQIYSACGKSIGLGERPFRSPHVSASISAIVGGGAGAGITPGEVSLAHNGVLYVHDYPSLPSAVKEALRAPIEDGQITISRLRNKVVFPANFFPVLASLPCPCGHYGGRYPCLCTQDQRSRYLERLSGPVFDRATMQVFVRTGTGKDATPGDRASVVAERVLKARELQIARQGKTNEQLSLDAMIDLVAPNTLDNGETVPAFMDKLTERLGLSARAYGRILKIARTIADLEGAESVTAANLVEAASYRFLDRIHADSI